MINLPHKEPIRFVKNLLEKKDDYIIVDCVFPFNPTISMVFEAAAQGSAGFANKDSEEKIGFLISLKNVEEFKTLDKTNFFIKINKIFQFGNMIEYGFELEDSSNIYVKGIFTIALQD